jgi:uncharacterized protein YigE (DUF2233 family)
LRDGVGLEKDGLPSFSISAMPVFDFFVDWGILTSRLA